MWRPGERVVVNGLVSRPSLNGATGTIISWDANSRRAGVTVDGSQTAKPVAIKAANLSVAEPLKATAPSLSGDAHTVMKAVETIAASATLPRPLRVLLDCSKEMMEVVNRSGRAQIMQAAVRFVSQALQFIVKAMAHSRRPLRLRVTHSDQGLFTNLCELVEAMAVAEALGAELVIDWRRSGAERHFAYGPLELDLLEEFFEPISGVVNAARSEGSARTCSIDGSVSSGGSNDGNGDGNSGGSDLEEVTLKTGLQPYFYSVVRGWLWSSRHLAALRSVHAEAAGPSSLRPVAVVRSVVDATLEEARRVGPRFVLGVHKRVSTPGVAAIQLHLRVPTLDEFVEAARTALIEWAAPIERDATPGLRFAGCAVLLASDDSAAQPAFVAACAAGGRLAGAQLVCRTGVRRTAGGTCDDGTPNETHLIGHLLDGGVTLQDGHDALADGLCLAGCAGLVHIDSSVAIFAALRNPELKLRNAGALLSPAQETHSSRDKQRLRVVHELVFVRSQPTVASAALGMKPQGDVVTTSGKWSGPWAELERGGWVLTDARHSSIEIDLGLKGPLGKLLEEV